MNVQRKEMLKLIEITSKAIKNINPAGELKSEIHRALDEDILKIKELNNECQPTDPINFLNNKLLDLFTESKKYIDANWIYIVDGDEQKLLYKSNKVSWEGTSILNYMQTAMLEILSVIYDASISNLGCLKEAGNIYQVVTSPDMQSTHIIGEDHISGYFLK